MLAHAQIVNVRSATAKTVKQKIVLVTNVNVQNVIVVNKKSPYGAFFIYSRINCSRSNCFFRFRFSSYRSNGVTINRIPRSELK